MRIESKATKFLLWGLALDVIIVLGLILLTVLSAYSRYDGKCPSFIMLDNGYFPCSFSEFLRFNLLLIGLMAVVFWWVTLPALLLPPLIGFAIGRYKSRASSQSGPPHVNRIFN